VSMEALYLFWMRLFTGGAFGWRVSFEESACGVSYEVARRV